MCAALTLTSCATVSYKTTGFDVLRPADYTLPAWADTVLMVDNVFAPACYDSTVPPADANFLANKETYVRSVATSMFDEMKSNFNESGYIKLRYLAHPHTLTLSAIDTLLKGHPSTVILSLDELESSALLKITGKTTTEDGEIIGCLDIEAHTKTRLTLLASPHQRMSLEPRNDTLTFTSCGASTADVVRGFPSLANRYKETGRETGRQYAASLLPTWQRVYRALYVTNSTEMSSAATWVEQEEWDEAKNLWLSIFNGKAKTPEKVRAALNMATACEREDNPVEASMWASKALDIIEQSDAKTQAKLKPEKTRGENMFNYLLNRQKEKKLLDKQMN